VSYDTTVLPAAFNRWVGLGGTEIKLVEVEAPLGAAAALVASGKERVLVTGLLRQAPCEVPDADVVVAEAPAISHEGGTLGATRTALRKFIQEALEEGEAPAILVDHLEIGATLRGLLGADGLPLVALGLLGRLMGERRGSGKPAASICLEPALVARRRRVAYVDVGLGRAPKRSANLVVPLRYLASAQHLVSLVDKAHASALFVVGAGRDELASLRDKLGPRIEVAALSTPRQLSLAGY
jgi:hypothetical protein